MIFSAETRAARDENNNPVEEKATMKYGKWKENYYANIRFAEKDESAIMRYIWAESYVLNNTFWNNLELTKEQKEWVETLDKALEKIPKYEGIVTRSLDFSDRKEELKEFLITHKINGIILSIIYFYNNWRSTNENYI